jgi:hypothetical protein
MSKGKLKVVETNERAELAAKQKMLDEQDTKNALEAFNRFIQSEEWTKHGCLLLPQGQFIGDKMKCSLVVVKSK